MKSFIILSAITLTSCMNHKIVYKVDACPKWLVNKQLTNSTNKLKTIENNVINLQHSSTRSHLNISERKMLAFIKFT